MEIRMLVAYATVAVVGMIVLLASALLGGDHDTDHDVGDDGGTHDADVHEEVFCRWLSIKVISAFAVAFGAGGAISLALGKSPLVSVFFAIPSGVALAYIARWLINLFYGQQCNSLQPTPNLTGKQGIVTQTILGGQVGQIKIMIGQDTLYRSARSQNGRIDQGMGIEIITEQADLVIVRAL